MNNSSIDGYAQTFTVCLGVRCIVYAEDSFGKTNLSHSTPKATDEPTRLNAEFYLTSLYNLSKIWSA